MSKFIPIEFQKSFQKTEQQAFAIKADYNENPDMMASRFGGYPYWEDGITIPCDEDGKPLALLAQINFAELQTTEQPAFNGLLAEGILQIFIPRDDELYGANLEQVGGKDSVITQFWDTPSIEKAIDWTQIDGTLIDENDLVPVFGAHTLTFTPKKEVAGIDTIECAESLDANPFEVLEDVAINEREESLFFDAITAYVSADGHKLLGYPSFINADPREDSEYCLLLQIDTDMRDDNDIMLGDNGIGQIFIRKQDLQDKNFANVWLYWDC